MGSRPSRRQSPCGSLEPAKPRVLRARTRCSNDPFAVRPEVAGPMAGSRVIRRPPVIGWRISMSNGWHRRTWRNAGRKRSMSSTRRRKRRSARLAVKKKAAAADKVLPIVRHRASIAQLKVMGFATLDPSYGLLAFKCPGMAVVGLMSAIGARGDLNGIRQSVAYDPKATLAVDFCCVARHSSRSAMWQGVLRPRGTKPARPAGSGAGQRLNTHPILSEATS